MPKINEAIDALLAYQQADMEGVMVLASRQAIHEVADELRRLLDAAQQPGMREALEQIEAIADRPISGTSLQTKANRFDQIKAKARAALAAQPPAAPVETLDALVEKITPENLHQEFGLECSSAASVPVPTDALVNLANYQEQCDQDGVMVKVSRQALAEVLVYVQMTRPDLNDEPQEVLNPLPVEAIRAAITLLARKITKLSWSRDECRRKGQDVYVANITAQMDTLDAYHGALTDLVVTRPKLDAGSGPHPSHHSAPQGE